MGYRWSLATCFTMLLLLTAVDGCQYDLHFRTIEASMGALPSHVGERASPDVIDCAKLCYNDDVNFCNSALFFNNTCRLSRMEVECPRDDQLGLTEPELVTVSRHPVLVFCIRCRDDNPELLPVSDDRSLVDENSRNDSVSPPNLFESDDDRFDAGPSTFFIQSNAFKFISLKVMTFNTWVAGRQVADGLRKVAKHIRINDPDIVALQEMTTDAVYSLHGMLYPQNWQLCKNSNNGGNYILTRLQVDRDYQPSNNLTNIGCRIRISDNPPKFVNVWNVHLDWRDYGPYTVCFEKLNTAAMHQKLIFNEYKTTGDSNGRINNLMGLLNHPPFFRNLHEVNNVPLIVTGDFNAPSHLDWTPSAKLLHCNTSFQWPVSKLMHDFDFQDSFRRVHPNPAQKVGVTWTPVYKMNEEDPHVHRPEPQDRIDFIYYKGSAIRPTNSRVYTGLSNLRLVPEHKNNDWPSDHGSVVTEFELLVDNKH